MARLLPSCVYNMYGSGASTLPKSVYTRLVYICIYSKREPNIGRGTNARIKMRGAKTIACCCLPRPVSRRWGALLVQPRGSAGVRADDFHALFIRPNKDGSQRAL